MAKPTIKKCPHCEKEILEFVQGCCPLCGVYRVIVPEPVEVTKVGRTKSEKGGE